jgi:hypothetical protein
MENPDPSKIKLCQLRFRGPGGVAGSLAQPLRHDHRRARGGGGGGQQRVEPAHPGVAEPGARLPWPWTSLMVSPTSSSAYSPDPGRLRRRCRGSARQRDQEPRGHRVELADMAEGERAQERPQRGGGVGVREDPAHPAAAGHVVDRVRARAHPGHQRGDLHSLVRTLVGGQPDMLVGQPAKPGAPPTPRSGTTPLTTRDSARRTPSWSGPGCERVASQRPFRVESFGTVASPAGNKCQSGFPCVRRLGPDRKSNTPGDLDRHRAPLRPPVQHREKRDQPEQP